jgi:hypothetical protein
VKIKNMSEDIKDAHCYYCDKDVKIIICKKMILTEIQGLNIMHDGIVAFCSECHRKVYSKEVDDKNIEEAQKEYDYAVDRWNRLKEGNDTNEGNKI